MLLLISFDKGFTRAHMHVYAFKCVYMNLHVCGFVYTCKNMHVRTLNTCINTMFQT
jgi:hypothetical protein